MPVTRSGSPEVRILVHGVWTTVEGIASVAMDAALYGDLRGEMLGLLACPPERSPLERALDILHPHLMRQPLYQPHGVTDPSQPGRSRQRHTQGRTSTTALPK